MEQETQEKRIKRLEATVDALKYYLERTNEHLLLLAIREAEQQGNSVNSEVQGIVATYRAIQQLRPCKKSNNY